MAESRGLGDVYKRQEINDIIKMTASIYTDDLDYEYENIDNKTKEDKIYDELMELVSSGDLNAADECIFDNLNPNSMNYLKLALNFYKKINELDDDELKSMDFERGEIKSAVLEILDAYGINFISK